MPDSDLMHSLDFTADDLAANRGGRLSPRQQARLRGMRLRSVAIGLVLLWIFALLAAALLYIGQRENSVILTLVGIGITIANTAILGIMARYWIRLTFDLQRGIARMLTGSAERVLRVSGSVTTPVLKIGGESFTVSKDTLKAIQHEAPYRVYHTPHAHILLALEPAQE